MTRRLTLGEFIIRAKKSHGDKYDYSKVEYVNNNTKVEIICPEHGSFWQRANYHMRGKGCQKCGLKKLYALKYSTDEFITKAKKIHGDKYDYSKTEYVSIRTKVEIICPEHGSFWQRASSHIDGNGCQRCGFKKGVSLRYEKYNTDYFINHAKKIHGDKYNYSKTEYVNAVTKVEIICPEHGSFWQRASSHINGSGCPRCYSKVSKSELEICEFLKENNIEYIQSDRKIIKPYEIDIVIPKYNLAIEYNGVYWHSEQILKKANRPPKTFHKMKYDKCKEKGYQLFTIFETEWILKKDIIKSMILDKCNLHNVKIIAKQCEIKKVSDKYSKIFLNENHIRGYKEGDHIGLFFKDQLVSLMSVKMEGKECNIKRFINKKGIRIEGSLNILLKYLTMHYKYKDLFIFIDNRFPVCSTYLQNKFYEYKNIGPAYYYFKDNHIFLNKFEFKNNKILNTFENYDNNLTEYENCLNNRYNRVWDCGKTKFKLITGRV